MVLCLPLWFMVPLVLLVGILQQEGTAAAELVKNQGFGASSLCLNPDPSAYCVTWDKIFFFLKDAQY